MLPIGPLAPRATDLGGLRFPASMVATDARQQLVACFRKVSCAGSESVGPKRRAGGGVKQAGTVMRRVVATTLTLPPMT